MQPAFETHVVSVGELFAGDNCFRLPIFQRAYAWREEQAAQLLDDLLSGFERIREKRVQDGPGSDFFVGPIILARPGLNGPFDVIDGQQRLVTLSMIIAVLRDLLSTGAFQTDLQKRLTRPHDSVNRVSESARIQVQESNRAHYERCVYQTGGTRSSSGHAPEQSDLLQAITRVRQDIGSPRRDYLESLARYILERTFLIRMQTKTMDDAYLLFRSVNSPGQPLSGLDLVKGELLGSDAPNNRDAIRLADAWDHIERGLGREKLEAYVNTVLTLSSSEYDGSDLKQGLRSIMTDAIRMSEFRRNLAQFIRRYSNLDNATLDYGPDSQIINRIVACFGGMPFDEWRPSALLWLIGQHTAHDALKFFRALNALCLALVILGTASGRRKARFDKINARVKDGSVLSAASSELFMTPQERADIRAKLIGAIPSTAKYVRALLLRINAEMQHAAIPPFFPGDITIEHVLPQTPAARSRWKKDFPDQLRRKELCLSLGNLTILTKDANSAIRNIDFEDKKSELFGIHGNQAFAVNQRIASLPSWNETVILRRRDELLEVTDRVLLG